MTAIADVVLAAMVLEILVMLLAAPMLGFDRLGGVLAVLPGLCLAAALRALAGGAGVPAVGSALLAALLCHAADLLCRRGLQRRASGAHSADG